MVAEAGQVVPQQTGRKRCDRFGSPDKEVGKARK